MYQIFHNFNFLNDILKEQRHMTWQLWTCAVHLEELGEGKILWNTYLVVPKLLVDLKQKLLSFVGPTMESKC